MCLNLISKNISLVFPIKAFLSEIFSKAFSSWLKNVWKFLNWNLDIQFLIIKLSTQKPTQFKFHQNLKRQKNIHWISIKNWNWNSTNDKYHHHETSKHIFQPNFENMFVRHVMQLFSDYDAESRSRWNFAWN